MHTGKIKKLVRERGFGFISDTDGRDVFFHRSDLKNIQWEVLTGDQRVEFEVEKSEKGPKAFNISVLEEQVQ